MEENEEKEIEPEAAREEERERVQDEDEPPMRDQGLDRSASGQHVVIEGTE